MGFRMLDALRLGTLHFSSALSTSYAQDPGKEMDSGRRSALVHDGKGKFAATTYYHQEQCISRNMVC